MTTRQPVPVGPADGDHPSFPELLGHAAGALEQSAAQAVDTHLAACDPCSLMHDMIGPASPGDLTLYMERLLEQAPQLPQARIVTLPAAVPLPPPMTPEPRLTPVWELELGSGAPDAYGPAVVRREFVEQPVALYADARAAMVLSETESGLVAVRMTRDERGCVCEIDPGLAGRIYSLHAVHDFDEELVSRGTVPEGGRVVIPGAAIDKVERDGGQLRWSFEQAGPMWL